jgi:hypothetical protein
MQDLPSTLPMEVYASHFFFQLPTFNNLRRQLRAYSFSWHQNPKDEEPQTSSKNLVFRHPYFIRGHAELLPYVVTRRKRGRTESEASPQLKALSRRIQEAGVSDVPFVDYLLPIQPFPVSRPYKRCRSIEKSAKIGTPGKLIEKAAALCDIPGVLGTQQHPLTSLTPSRNGDINGYPDITSTHWSDVAKGGVSCNIPVKYWNDSPENESIPAPPPPVQVPSAYGQYYAPHPYDPYGYYQYPEPWGSHDHGQYYSSHPGPVQPIQGHEIQHPLDSNGHYYVDQQAPATYGYYEPPTNVSDVATPVAEAVPVTETPKSRPTIEAEIPEVISENNGVKLEGVLEDSNSGLNSQRN